MLGKQQGLRIGNQHQVHQHARHAADEDAQALCNQLLVWRRADRLANLEVVHQVGGLPGRAAGSVGAHQVDGHLAWGDQAKAELRQLADGADRRNTGGADHARGDHRKAYRQGNAQQRHPPVDAEQQRL
ncbi:hypothetical protein D3C77_591460 [compost metagenome]